MGFAVVVVRGAKKARHHGAHACLSFCIAVRHASTYLCSLFWGFHCKRYEYLGHYFFSSDRVFVVLSPPPQLRAAASDQLLALLLANDPCAVSQIGAAGHYVHTAPFDCAPPPPLCKGVLPFDLRTATLALAFL